MFPFFLKKAQQHALDLLSEFDFLKQGERKKLATGKKKKKKEEEGIPINI